jgi:hypothetical protein
MKILLIILLIELILVIVFVIGEKVVDKKPNSKFSMWWRKYVVGGSMYGDN